MSAATGAVPKPGCDVKSQKNKPAFVTVNESSGMWAQLLLVLYFRDSYPE